MNEYNSIKDVADLNAALIYQTVTLPTIAHFRDRGGNALGITEEDGPLICKYSVNNPFSVPKKPTSYVAINHTTVIEIDVAWSSESDDDRAKAASRNTINLGTALAKEKGVHHPFIFLNYADREQVVFPTYGEKSFSKLVAASEKYDPDQVWQTFQPQIFRLNPAHAV